MNTPPTLYENEMQGGWWPGIERTCTVCLPAKGRPAPRLFWEPTGGLHMPGRIYCIACEREPYTVLRCRVVTPRSAYEREPRGRPPKQRDYHPTTPCRGDGCGNEIRVRYKTGLCRRCLDANGRRGLP